MLPTNFDYVFVHRRQKARLRPEIFVNFRPEPGSKSPGRLTTLLQWRLCLFKAGQQTILIRVLFLYHHFWFGLNGNRIQILLHPIDLDSLHHHPLTSHFRRDTNFLRLVIATMRLFRSPSGAAWVSCSNQRCFKQSSHEGRSLKHNVHFHDKEQNFSLRWMKMNSCNCFADKANN